MVMYWALRARNIPAQNRGQDFIRRTYDFVADLRVCFRSKFLYIFFDQSRTLHGGRRKTLYRVRIPAPHIATFFIACSFFYV